MTESDQMVIQACMRKAGFKGDLVLTRSTALSWYNIITDKKKYEEYLENSRRDSIYAAAAKLMRDYFTVIKATPLMKALDE